MDVTIRPDCTGYVEALTVTPEGHVFGHSLVEWREKTRLELGLATDRPIFATGHQALLWHPGILAKYLLVDAVTSRDARFASANLVVDQHAGGYADLLLPVRRRDGGLGERLIQLTSAPKDVPMALHEPFTPPRPPARLDAALPSVSDGVAQICQAVYDHRDADNAALQMADALWDLMSPWVAPMPNITATDLMQTTFARRLLEAMVDDPWCSIEAYNRAVRAHPEAGIGTLLVRDDYVELPLWRIRSDGRRMHAYDNDAHTALSDRSDTPQLMPRALFMTALVRLVMSDVFVHGTGGAIYDAAMEDWIEDWLGVSPSPKGVATATLRLPLVGHDETDVDVLARRRDLRRVWHNPEHTPTVRAPGPVKRRHLDDIASAQRGSTARRQAYFEMHRSLDNLRSENAGRLDRMTRQAQEAERAAEDQRIASRRHWAFPLYPRDMLDRLASTIRRQVETTLACRPLSDPSA